MIGPRRGNVSSSARRRRVTGIATSRPFGHFRVMLLLGVQRIQPSEDSAR